MSNIEPLLIAVGVVGVVVWLPISMAMDIDVVPAPVRDWLAHRKKMRDLRRKFELEQLDAELNAKRCELQAKREAKGPFR